MRKIICAPEYLIPLRISDEIKYFSAYSDPHRESVGYFGSALIKDIVRAGLCPSAEVWDFNTIALSVAAADMSLSRAKSADGWTRQIDLTIHLCNPAIWESVKNQLQKTLRFLTGDFWYITFKDRGSNPPRAKNIKYHNCDCIALLSGGIDSLVGAIDFSSSKLKPIFVSQIVKGDKDTQKLFTQKIRPESAHFQWSHTIHQPDEERELSTRGRSIVFLAFAALASSAFNTQVGRPINIYVPENGFTSLNLPLNSGRLGSFSTRTTHPVYLQGIQNIWTRLNMNIDLVTPYKFMTKGELLSECKNRSLMCELIGSSTSCGKYLRHGYQHCGRCVPCLVRRAAFLKAGFNDSTVKGYKYENLSSAGRTDEPNDLGAMAAACLNIDQFGIKHVISGNLSFAKHDQRTEFEGVIARGFKEVETLLIEHGVI